MPRPERLSAAQARRVNLAAQGLAEPRPRGRIDRRHLRRVLDRVGLVQIDSVNVLQRAHYLPFFSRLGPYDTTILDRLAYEDHELFEYWGHAASLLPVELQPLLRWRMRQDHMWKGMRAVGDRHADLVETLRSEIHRRGPISAGDLAPDDRTKEPWWGWGPTKQAVEYLFHAGEVGAVRRANFERAYCHPSQCLPASILDAPTPDDDDAHRRLLLRAARSHGVGTAGDLADYFRMKTTPSQPLLDSLVDAGALTLVEVEGWHRPAYLHPEARIPRRVGVCALVSPFDSVMWDRDRVRRLFGFDYKIEIYVPKAQRRYGYYVLPFLLGDRYVARVDCKADRAGRRLLVRAAHQEPGVDDLEVAERLAGELRSLATWLDLDGIDIADRGDLAPALTAVSR